jgi:hypothetical protein
VDVGYVISVILLRLAKTTVFQQNKIIRGYDFFPRYPRHQDASLASSLEMTHVMDRYSC